MSLYGHLIRRVVFPLYEKGLRGRPTVRYFRDYQENEFLSESNLLDLQARKLVALLRHCYQQVPYYQQVFNQRGIPPADIPTIDELSILPILDKKSIRQNYQSLISKESSPSPVRKATGGSTGVPLTFEHDRDSYYRRVAVMWRGYGCAGARLGDPTIYLWGAPTGEMSAFGRAKEAMYHALNGRRMLNAFELSDSNVDQYIDEIQRYKPKTIVAYVAPLVEVARYCRAKKVTPFSPDSIITGAEPLPEASREFLQQVFRCPVFNTYGSREFMLIAAECERHAGLHINI
ncbi:MAG: AMP-binding protein, partial [Cyanobacteria bacterium P01_F01_bin.42]